MITYKSIDASDTIMDVYSSFGKLIESSMTIAEKISIISKFITNKHGSTFTQQEFSHGACRALIALGQEGIQEYASLINSNITIPYFSTVLRDLWEASKNIRESKIMFDNTRLPTSLRSRLDDSTIRKAKATFYAYIKNCQIDDEKLYWVINLLFSEMLNKQLKGNTDMQKDILRIISESSIRISPTLINKYKQLIASEHKEEVYQQFFASNPVFLHPLGKSTVDKHKLGKDLITDFVIQTIEREYYLVEIEKPQDLIFTKSNDFSSKFSHALGQVVDFISWIEENIAYAEKSLPGITSPKGILIIGNNHDLTVATRKKLNKFSASLYNIEIKTFDDVLEYAENLYNNIITSDE